MDLPSLNLTEVFEKIENEEHWFSQTPDNYLKQLGYAAPQKIQTPIFTPFEGVLHPVGEMTNHNPGDPPGQEDAGQSIVRKFSYNTAFERFKISRSPSVPFGEDSGTTRT